MRYSFLTLYFALANVVLCLIAGVQCLATQPELRLVDVARTLIGVFGCPLLIRKIQELKKIEKEKK